MTTTTPSGSVQPYQPPVQPPVQTYRADTYSFGMPKALIWLVHIIIGIYFIYLGNQLQNVVDFEMHGTIVLVIGIVMVLYHLFIWLSSPSLPSEPQYHHNQPQPQPIMESYGCGCT